MEDAPRKSISQNSMRLFSALPGSGVGPRGRQTHPVCRRSRYRSRRPLGTPASSRSWSSWPPHSPRTSEQRGLRRRRRRCRRKGTEQRELQTARRSERARVKLRSCSAAHSVRSSTVVRRIWATRSPGDMDGKIIKPKWPWK